MSPRHSTTPTTSWSGDRTTLPGSVRRAVHKRDRCCVDCGATAGLEVDHQVNVAEARLLGWSDEQIHSLDNLALRCEPCHARKTRGEQARGMRRFHSQRERPTPRHPGMV